MLTIFLIYLNHHIQSNMTTAVAILSNNSTVKLLATIAGYVGFYNINKNLVGKLALDIVKRFNKEIPEDFEEAMRNRSISRVENGVVGGVVAFVVTVLLMKVLPSKVLLNASVSVALLLAIFSSLKRMKFITK